MVTRGGITWALNLREGIDLAIYLLGGFEVRTLHSYRRLIHDGDCVLDIGANIGAHTLPLAQLVGDSGKVLVFEPTKYAFDKLRKNIALNPQLASRVILQQMMLVSSDLDMSPIAVYSSWPLERSSDLHPDHQGRLMSTQGMATATLDKYVQVHDLHRIDVIKLDVDGNEYDVLLGGEATLRRFRPTLIMELAPYVHVAEPEKFDKTLMLLWGLGYQIADVTSGERFPQSPEKIRCLIPLTGSINAVATAA
jgi:FkbM family methyltransferase